VTALATLYVELAEFCREHRLKQAAATGLRVAGLILLVTVALWSFGILLPVPGLWEGK